MADALDSKSSAFTGVRVQLPPPAPSSDILISNDCRRRVEGWDVAVLTGVSARWEGSAMGLAGRKEN